MDFFYIMHTKWQRHYPLCFYLVLLSSAGLAIGDVPDKQPIGIVLTVLGVVVLDFCADATEGPIRAYLLDVADNEEQDMALNIHAFSAGTYLTHYRLLGIGQGELLYSETV